MTNDQCSDKVEAKPGTNPDELAAKSDSREETSRDSDQGESAEQMLVSEELVLTEEALPAISDNASDADEDDDDFSKSPAELVREHLVSAYCTASLFSGLGMTLATLGSLTALVWLWIVDSFLFALAIAGGFVVVGTFMRLLGAAVHVLAARALFAAPGLTAWEKLRVIDSDWDDAWEYQGLRQRPEPEE